MTSQNQLKRLDRMLAPFVKAVNFAAMHLSSLFGRYREKHLKFPINAKTVTVAKFEGMGSIVYAAGMIAALRQSLPDLKKVIFFTKDQNRDFVSRIQGVDEVVVLVGDNLFTIFTSWISGLRKTRSDIYIDLEVYSHFSALTATASCSWWRAGFFRESANYRTGLFTHSIFFNNSRHISENYMQILRAFNFPCYPTAIPKFRTTASEESVAKLITVRTLDSHKFLVVNPHASDLLIERRWPLEKFAKLIAVLLERNASLRILVSGSRSERDYSQKLVSLLPEPHLSRVSSVAGELGLGEFISLLSCVDVLLTNDSGPLHLGLAGGVPTVSLWGPGNPNHYGPSASSGHIVFYKNIFCSPCLYQTDPPPCRGKNICMMEIPYESVVDAIEIILNSPPKTVPFIMQPCVDLVYENGRSLSVATNHNFKKSLQ